MRSWWISLNGLGGFYGIIMPSVVDNNKWSNLWQKLKDFSDFWNICIKRNIPRWWLHCAVRMEPFRKILTDRWLLPLPIHYQPVKSGKSVFKKMSSNSLSACQKCESKSKPVENFFKHWFSVLGLARILLKEFAIYSFKIFEFQQWKYIHNREMSPIYLVKIHYKSMLKPVIKCSAKNMKRKTMA